MHMAKRSASFNLSGTIREFQKSHRGVPATAALDAVKKAHPKQRINESTFRATFYKLASGGKRKVVKRRKPGRFVPGHGSADHIMKAGLNFRATRWLGTVDRDGQRGRLSSPHRSISFDQIYEESVGRPADSSAAFRISTQLGPWVISLSMTL
jgi:hypothetical protein